MSSFEDAFALLIGNEGKLSMDSKDPGNWTGGKVGVGTLKGTKYGIAASQHPDLDIANLTLDDARGIAKAHYWDTLHLDEFDPRVAFQIFDANYNGGHPVLWMQQSSGSPPDCKLGPVTIAAVKATSPLNFIMNFLSYRIDYLTDCKPWPTQGRGWSKRMAKNLRTGAK